MGKKNSKFKGPNASIQFAFSRNSRGLYFWSNMRQERVKMISQRQRHRIKIVYIL